MSDTTLEEDGSAIGILKFISEDCSTWHFQSRDDTKVFHTVDLTYYDCSGACSCPHFEIRIRRLLEARLIKPHSSRAKCKHIRRAEQILIYRLKRKLFR